MGQKIEKYIGNNLFLKIEEIQKTKCAILKARKYSMSKLTIALSDYVCILWVSIVIFLIIKYYNCYTLISNNVFFIF